MSNLSVHAPSYRAYRWTVDIDSTPHEFRARYEEPIPPLPVDQVNALVRRQAAWQEMVDLMETAAPSGFVIYLKTEVDRLMSLAGDDTSCTSYLMGNHIIAERMFRHETSSYSVCAAAYSHLGALNGPAHFTFDQPSDQFRSLGNVEITAVGVELDRKLAALLFHLGVTVPDELRAT